MAKYDEIQPAEYETVTLGSRADTVTRVPANWPHTQTWWPMMALRFQDKSGPLFLPACQIYGSGTLYSVLGVSYASRTWHRLLSACVLRISINRLCVECILS